MLTYLLIDQSAHITTTLLVFFGTLITYNFSLSFYPIKVSSINPKAQETWNVQHTHDIQFLFIAALIGSAVCVSFLKLKSAILVFFLGVLCIGYHYLFIPKKGKKISLRQVKGIKLFIISFVWAAACVLIPIVESDGFVSTKNIFVLFLNMFLFIMTLTIPFDIRDVYEDQRDGLKTIPVLFGNRFAINSCALLILINAAMYYYKYSHNLKIVIGMVTTLVITAVLIIRPLFRKNNYYYLLLLDGMLLVQYLLIYFITRI